MNENMTAPQAIDMSFVKPGWIVIFVGWFILLVPIPFTAWIGWLVACVGGTVLAIVNLTRGIVGVGLAQLACALVGTCFFYWIGLTLFAGAVLTVLSG
jgi:hypothetical protein